MTLVLLIAKSFVVAELFLSDHKFNSHESLDRYHIIRTIMLLGLLKYALCLAVMSRVDHVEAQTAPVPVVGMTSGINPATGAVPSRMNINILEKEGGPMWYDIFLRSWLRLLNFSRRLRDLFIRGLDALQNETEDDPRSYFAVAGKDPSLRLSFLVESQI